MVMEQRTYRTSKRETLERVGEATFDEHAATATELSKMPVKSEPPSYVHDYSRPIRFARAASAVLSQAPIRLGVVKTEELHLPSSKKSGKRGRPAALWGGTGG